MRTILMILANTIRVTFRRKSAFLVYLALPIGGILLSLAIHTGAQSQPLAVGVVDNDGSRISSELVASVESWKSYTIREVTAAEVNARITSGKLDGAMIIPRGFGRSILTGADDLHIRLVSIKGSSGTGALEMLLNQYCSGLSEIGAAAHGDASAFERLYASSQANGAQLEVRTLADEAANKGTTATGVGYLVLFIMLGAGLTSQLILAEKQNGTFNRVRSAPVQMKQYLAGNGAAGFAIIVMQILVVMMVLRLILHVDTYVPDVMFFAILAVFGLVAVALGMVTTALSKSSAMAAAFSTLILTPSCMLAGCFWPLSFMPPFMQKLALFMPQRWVLDAIERMQKGSTAVGINFLILAAFALALFLMAVYGFSRSEEKGQFV